jgi:hypothetical protein
VTHDLVVVPVDKSLPDNEVVTILHASTRRQWCSPSYRDTVITLSAAGGLRHLVDMDLPARDGRLQR